MGYEMLQFSRVCAVFWGVCNPQFHSLSLSLCVCLVVAEEPLGFRQRSPELIGGTRQGWEGNLRRWMKRIEKVFVYTNSKQHGALHCVFRRLNRSFRNYAYSRCESHRNAVAFAQQHWGPDLFCGLLDAPCHWKKKYCHIAFGRIQPLRISEAMAFAKYHTSAVSSRHSKKEFGTGHI